MGNALPLSILCSLYTSLQWHFHFASAGTELRSDREKSLDLIVIGIFPMNMKRAKILRHWNRLEMCSGK